MSRQQQFKVSYQLKDLTNGHYKSQGHCFGVNAIVQNNETLFTAGRDSFINAWDVTQEQPTIIDTFAHHTHWINDIKFCTPTVLASCSSDTTVKLWNVNKKLENKDQLNTDREGRTAGVISTLEGHKDYVLCLSYNKENRLLSSSGLDCQVCTWDLAHSTSPIHTYFDPPSESKENTTMLHGTIKNLKKSIYSIASVENLIVTGGTEHVLRGWDPRTSECCFKLRGHHDVIRDIILINGGSKIITASSDFSIKIWDTNMRKCVKSYFFHKDSVWSLALDETSILYSGGRDGNIYATDLSTATSKLIIEGKKEYGGITDIYKNDRNQLWVSSSNSGSARQFTLPNQLFEPIDKEENELSSSPNLLSPLKLAVSPSPHKISLLTSKRLSVGAHGVNGSNVPMALIEPSVVLPSKNGIVKHHILNDRTHILTEDNNRLIQLWNVLLAKKVKDIGLSANSTDTESSNTLTWESAIVTYSKKHLCIPNWFSIDTKLGFPSVHLDAPTCFEAVVDGKFVEFNDTPGAVNIGERVLSTLFENWKKLKMGEKKAKEAENQGEVDDSKKKLSAPSLKVNETNNKLQTLNALPLFDMDNQTVIVITDKHTGRPLLSSTIADLTTSDDHLIPPWVSNCLLLADFTSKEQNTRYEFILCPLDDKAVEQYKQIKWNISRGVTVKKMKLHLSKTLNFVQPPIKESSDQPPPEIESYFEFSCKGQTLDDPSLTAAAIKTFYWKSSESEVTLHYRILNNPS